MFYSDGFLHAIVDDAGSSEDKNESKSSIPESEAKPNHNDNGTASCNNDETGLGSKPNPKPIDSISNESNEKISRRQQQKEKRKLKKQHAKELNNRHTQLEDNLTKDKATSSPLKNPTHEAAATPLRLHQFVSTVFRSELNVAENGAGHFIKNAPKVSAHHAFLQGAVHLNGTVCKFGRTALAHGDVVSLQLEPEFSRREGELMAWRGSEEVAKMLGGSTHDNEGERQGRMMASMTDAEASIQKDASLSECEMIIYYREKLGKAWIPEVHESAIMQPLPVTLRVLKPTARLAKELLEFGFSPVTEEEDFSLQLSCLDGNETKQLLSTSTMQELLSDTWIARGDKYLKNDDADEKKLGLFLSEARVTGELMQQELTSMIPVSIIAANVKNQTWSKKRDVRFLDLCSAPGSKTCQLLSALDIVMSKNNENAQKMDCTLVANELNLQRANLMRQRLHQQNGSKSLSNLIITCADGRAYAKMEQNSFDFVLCDVPCSGDGTVRKSPKILRKWSPKNAAKNKILQKELLKVGLGLLRPSSESSNNGGFLVYSTCSLNPLENEQVISEVMDELNGDEESSSRYELVDLSEESLSPPSTSDSGNCGGCNNNKNLAQGNFLRVLPAKSHGGFFVAGIRKLAVAAGGDDCQVVEPCAEKGDVAIIDNDKHHELVVQKHVRSMGDVTISYSISPCTRRCRAELIEKLGTTTIVSSGVAVLYDSSKDGRHVLQQGCASLVSLQQQELFGCIQMSHVELVECHAKRSAHREVLLPMDRVHTKKRLDRGMPLIVEVGVSSSEGCQSLLLPARIVQVLKDDNDDDDAAALERASSVVVKILARPQIFKRALDFS